MADNVSIKDATDASVSIAADEISGVFYQRVKLAYGDSDAATQVSTANPLPVTALALPNVTISSQPALAATTDTVTARLDSSTMSSGVTALTPKFAKANIAASQTAASLVASVASKKLRVLSLAMVTGGTATNVTLNTASTAISPLYANAANGGVVLPFSPVGWFETVAGEALTVTTGAGSTTGIQVVYVEV